MTITITPGTATIGTEYSLIAGSTTLGAGSSTICKMQVVIDFAAMVAGDSFQVRITETVNGNIRDMVPPYVLSYGQSSMFTSPMFLVGTGWNVTIKKLSASDRALAWSLYKEDNTAVATVSGAVGSVTGAVGSVTGAVGSVTGAVGSVTGNVGGTVASVVGAVGSVTGNVGGNVTGSVGSVTGNVGGSVATVTALATDAISAAALSTAGVTKIVDAVFAYAHETARTFKGVVRRLDALMTGKATGLLGTLATFYRADGTTKAIEATQDTTLGTRQTASTVAGD